MAPVLPFYNPGAPQWPIGKYKCHTKADASRTGVQCR
uniref:Uncharacterized protein n=1 Tax=Arundo donax TaxID=35708 RepID=A0A0A8YV21_ARUDO